MNDKRRKRNLRNIHPLKNKVIYLSRFDIPMSISSELLTYILKKWEKSLNYG